MSIQSSVENAEVCGQSPVSARYSLRCLVQSPLRALSDVVSHFNRGFGFTLVQIQCSLEVVFLWVLRLPSGISVYWAVSKEYATWGETKLLNFRKHRYWELVGCTTRGASESQFRHGAGWWQNFECHPNCPSDAEKARRAKYYYDHGTGIMYWRKFCGGRVTHLDRQRVEEGHCTSINFSNYQRLAPVNKKLLGPELDLNFDLEQIARRLEIESLL